MNHEIVNTLGVARAHGQPGAFVSRWVISKSTLAVISIQDFLQNSTSVYLSNNNQSTGTVHTGYLAAATTVISRLCSADLAAPTAYQWTDTGTGITYGTAARIFQSGEESGGSVTGVGPEATTLFGRQFAWVATDDPNTALNEAGTAWELPHAGLFSWENNLANPLAQRKTIVMGMDDGSPIGQIYMWVGDKQTSGNVVERAGLTKQGANDNMYVLRVPSLATVDGSGVPVETLGTAVSGAFTMVNEGDVSGQTLSGLEALSDSHGAAQFLRPEDGQWDPNNPSDFYFLTTSQYDQTKDGVGSTTGRSRLYKLHFTDISNPEAGGTITCLLDGTEAGNMFDNMTVSNGKVIIQEDVGNQQHLGKIWSYDIATDTLTQIAQHDRARFGDVGVAATSPFNQDEESSGVIDVSDILGAGRYLAVVQAHYAIPGELVEGGQLLMMQTNVTTGSQLVTTLTATDPDAATTLTYSITGGLDSTKFSIDPTTGKLSFVTAPNFEAPTDNGTNNVYDVTIGVSDGTNTTTQAIQVTVTAVNETPTNTTTETVSVGENGTAATTATGTDPEGTTLAYAISGGADAGKFTINSTSGVLTFLTAPNFEAPTDNGANNSYFVTVTVSDGVNAPVNKTVVVNVTNVDDIAPIISSGATAPAINENSGAAQVIYTTSSTDADVVSGSTSYSLKPATGDIAAFTINGTTGAVTLIANPNFETKSSYSSTVVATDAAGNFSEKAVTLAISNLDEVPPTITSGAVATAIAENSGASRVVYTVTATDSADISGGITYGLGTGGDESAFTINPSTGAVTLTGNPNFESKSSYSFTVTASDGVNPATTKVVTLAINNLDEVGPTITSGSTALAINENSGAGRVVYTVTATDSADISGGITYGLGTGGDESAFTINPSTGAVTLTGNPNFESKSSYSFTVTASDGVNPAATRVVTLAIIDVNEAIFEGNVFYNTSAAADKNFSPDQTGQRSLIRNVQIVFNGDVAVPTGAVTNSSFVLSRLGAGAANIGLTVISRVFSAGKTTVVLGFTSGTEILSGSLLDGNYRLVVDYGRLGIDGNGDGQIGGLRTINFHRFFGDSDGDRDVDANDYKNYLLGTRGNSSMLSLFDRAGDNSLLDDRDAFFANYTKRLDPFNP